MPRKRRQQETEPHIYSVFVDAISEDGTHTTTNTYFGYSEHTARLRLAAAILERPDAIAVEVRRDLRPWKKVRIERPNWP